MNSKKQLELFPTFDLFELPLGQPYDPKIFPKNSIILETVDKARNLLMSHEKIMCSISGGWDSDIMLDLLIRCGGRSKVTFCFFDTGLEYEATKRHLQFLESTYGISIKTLKAKKSIPVCCKKYGVPFWSKYASEMIHRLQRNGFQWEDELFEILLHRYPKCKSALRWWCNKWGDNSRFNISWVPSLKEFMVKNPPTILISSSCCEKAKKEPAHEEELYGGYDLICTGVRKMEGGKRATGFHSCFDQKMGKADYYRPLFWWSDQDKEQYTQFFNITRSDCYDIWGMDRTGCSGCPFGKNFENELNLVQEFEPKRYKAINAIFGESYDYTRKFLAFRENAKRESRVANTDDQISFPGF